MSFARLTKRASTNPRPEEPGLPPDVIDLARAAATLSHADQALLVGIMRRIVAIEASHGEEVADAVLARTMELIRSDGAALTH